MKTEERVLVVYYSRTGNTERVARDLAARLHADIERIDDRAKRGGVVGYMGAAYDSVRNVAADMLNRVRILRTTRLPWWARPYGLGA